MYSKARWSVIGLALIATTANAQNTFPSSGSVGIGTTTPNDLLDLFKIQSGETDLYIENRNATAASTQTGIVFTGFRDVSNPWPLAKIQVQSQTSAAGELAQNGEMRFYTGGYDLGGLVQRMVIQSGGNVGVGTTSPVSKLHIGAGSGDGITIGNPNDPLGNGGTYAIKFYGYRDIIPNAISAKMTAERTNACCGWLAQGTDLAFYTTNSLVTPNADNSTERMRIKDNGNIGIGTTSPGAKLEVNGGVKLTSGTGASITFADGTVQSTAYTGVTCGGDYAESVDVTGDRTRYEPGDVLVIDPSSPGKFLKANEPYSTLVAGIFSTKPGTVGRRQTTPKSPEEVPMAMIGIVPTKVTAENGPIKTGDLLVASSTLGRAMKGTDRSLFTGAVIGKALQSLESGNGVIEVLVTLQ